MATTLAILLIAVIVSSFVLMSIWDFRPDKNFYKQWPAIDDEEFLRRCPAGTRREVALRARKIISQQLGIPYEHIYPEQDFVNDLDCS